MKGYIALFLLASGCHQLLAPDPFKDDKINDFQMPKYETPFRFEPWMIPKIGVTTEAEVMKYHPQGPRNIRTFVCPYEGKVLGKPVMMDRVILYTDDKVREISGPGVTGYFGVDYLSLRIYFRHDIVVAYVISHNVRKKQADPWSPGRYDMTGVPNDRPRLDEVMLETYAYEAQRADPEKICGWKPGMPRL
jgi:hypothetical protein